MEKLIGVATHLCGDIYAHKTVVPLDTTFTATTVPSTRNNSTIYRGTSTDFNGNGRWSAAHGIKTLITGGSTITTQQITQWQFGSNGTSYPDYKNFYYERWNVATKQLVAEMYDNFFGKASLAYNSFFINWFLHTNYSLKLANLKLYAYSIGSEPAAEDKLSRLNALDSAVAISDVLPAGGYKTPSDSGNQWKKGYVSSY